MRNSDVAAFPHFAGRDTLLIDTALAASFLCGMLSQRTARPIDHQPLHPPVKDGSFFSDGLTAQKVVGTEHAG
jgi:hypothetical protein